MCANKKGSGSYKLYLLFVHTYGWTFIAHFITVSLAQTLIMQKSFAIFVSFKYS